VAVVELCLKSPDQGTGPAASAAVLQVHGVHLRWQEHDRMAGKAETPAVDLDAMTAQQLTTLIEAAKAKRESKLEEAKATLRAEMERKAAELGIAANELFSPAKLQAPGEKAATRGRKPRDDEGAKRPVKYRGPNGDEWSGRGRTPRWLEALQAEGRGREEFLVQD